MRTDSGAPGTRTPLEPEPREAHNDGCAPSDFNPAQHKEASRKQWDSAAEAWRRWEPVVAAWMSDATDAMLEMAEIGAGQRVLDIAAGAGNPADAL